MKLFTLLIYQMMKMNLSQILIKSVVCFLLYVFRIRQLVTKIDFRNSRKLSSVRM